MTRTGYPDRARRSASLSQSFTARMTSSRGGIPFGKSALSSASRSAELPLRRRPSVRAALREAAVLDRRAAPAASVVVVERVAAAAVDCRDRWRAELGLFEVPTTPCA